MDGKFGNIANFQFIFAHNNYITNIINHYHKTEFYNNFNIY